MNQQPELFYENFLDALRDDVKAIGGSKAVGHTFWPEKDVTAAGNAVNDRLNPDRRDRFTDEQERFVMRRARALRGFSAAVCFICDDTGFERPTAKNPEDEIAKRQREFIDAVKRVERIGHELQKLGGMPGVAPLTVAK